MSKIMERIVSAERIEDMISVFGSFDENIRRIEDALSVSIINRGTELKISGDEESVDKAARTLEGLFTLASKGEVIDEQRVRYLITLVQQGDDDTSAGSADGVADGDGAAVYVDLIHVEAQLPGHGDGLSGKGLVAHKIAHNPCVHRVIKLLDQISHNQRNGKRNQLCCHFSLRHIYAFSATESLFTLHFVLASNTQALAFSGFGRPFNPCFFR